MKRIVLGFSALVVLCMLLPGQGTFRGGWLQDDTLGFKVKVPSKWRQIPTKPDEQWVVGLFQSKKEYVSRDGWSRKLMMRVIMFDKNAPSKERKKEQNQGVVVFGRNLMHRNFRDYVKRTQGGGGFFFSVDKERKSGVPGNMYEVKFDKLANAKRRVIAWDYQRGDQSFAVEFDIYEEHYKKLRSMINQALRSFKFIAMKAPVDEVSASVKIPGKSAWKKLSMAERHKLRKELEAQQERRLRQKLPADWKVTKSKHFLVISHADAKFTKSVVTLAEACFGWLDKRFSGISDEYVRRSILRICRDADEYRGYHTSGSGGFGLMISFGMFSREVSELQFYKGEVLRDSWGSLMRNLFSHYISDKDDDLMDDVPTWVRSGIGYWLNGTVVKGRKVTFEPTLYERMELAKLKKKGGFRNGSLKSVRELINMTPKQVADLDKADGAVGYQMGALVRFLEGRGKKSKQFRGKDFLIEYCRASSAAEQEYVKKHPGSGSRTVKAASTEEEEEQQAARQRERSEQYSR
ncbi:MAG: hypothetical protein VX951_13565, partial [Planctomycetota bacterium]|nr:hypothetical protein [Planctomycetota bacterium]